MRYEKTHPCRKVLGNTLDQAGSGSKQARELAIALTLLLLLGQRLSGAPGPPQNLRLLQQGPDPTRLAFAWNAPAAGPAASYQVYLNDWFQAGITSTVWVDENLLPDTEYRLTVRAVDAAGDVSAPVSLSARTLTMPTLKPAYRWNTILLRYADYPDTPFAPLQVNDWFYSPTGSVNAYFSDVSYGRTSIAGQVYGWFTLPQPAAYYHTRGTNQGLWWGPDLGKIIADMAPLVPPEAGQNVDGQILVLHGTGDAGSSAGSYKMISSRLGQSMISTVVHEFGHSLASDTSHLGHPGGWLCTNAPVGPSLLNPRTAGCQAYIYGYEPFDPLGSGTRHLMSYHKWLLGMIDAAQVITAEEGATHDLSALAVSGGTKMLKIPLYWEYFYFVEYRKPIGLDDADLFPGSNNNQLPIDGVLVRLRVMGPSGISSLAAYPPGQLNTPLVCKPGLPFVDPYRGIRIEVVSKSGNIARVQFTRIPRISPETRTVTHNSATARFEVSWRSELGATYLLERSLRMDGDWSSLHTGNPFLGFPDNGAGGAATTYSETNRNPSGYYRIRRL